MHSDKNYTASFLYFNVNDIQIATEASLLSLSIWFTIFHGNVIDWFICLLLKELRKFIVKFSYWCFLLI